MVVCESETKRSYLVMEHRLKHLWFLWSFLLWVRSCGIHWTILCSAIEIVNKTFVLLFLIYYCLLKIAVGHEEFRFQFMILCAFGLWDDENKLSTCCARPSVLKCRDSMKRQISNPYHAFKSQWRLCFRINSISHQPLSKKMLNRFNYISERSWTMQFDWERAELNIIRDMKKPYLPKNIPQHHLDWNLSVSIQFHLDENKNEEYCWDEKETAYCHMQTFSLSISIYHDFYGFPPIKPAVAWDFTIFLLYFALEMPDAANRKQKK